MLPHVHAQPHSHSQSRLIPIQIETLAGTSFELLVSPHEQIQYIKRKIERREGIPISHQHLIWKTTELEDESCLNDYQIESGTTLKLVLAMRGGPVNTRRVPIEVNFLRDMSDYVDNGRDDCPVSSEVLPSANKNVTFLVLRDGDQFNFFQVIDRGDGTLSPLSGSMRFVSLSLFVVVTHPPRRFFSTTSMYNAHETLTVEPDEKRQADDQKTREKMEQIRSKLKPHPRKVAPLVHHAARPSSSSKTNVIHHHRRSLRIDTSSNISTNGSVPSISSPLEQTYRPLAYSYGATDLFHNVVERRDEDDSEDDDDDDEDEDDDEEEEERLTPSVFHPENPPIDGDQQVKTPDDFLPAERTSTSQSLLFRHPTSSTVITPAPTLTKKVLLPAAPPTTTQQFYPPPLASKSTKLPSSRPLVPLSLSKYRRIPANVPNKTVKPDAPAKVTIGQWRQTPSSRRSSL